MSIYYQDESVTLHHGKAEDVLPGIQSVSAVMQPSLYDPAPDVIASPLFDASEATA